MIEELGAAIATNPVLAQMGTPFLPTWAVEPEDVVDAVCWLASDGSRFATAAAISVDQGMAQF